MSYIYNILVNIEHIPYEIFDWEYNKIYEIGKTPVFKLKSLSDFYNYDIVVVDDFIELIKNKTKCIKKFEYACIFISEDDALFCVFNYRGKIIYKSKLLFNEECEALNMYDTIEYTNIKYKKNKINYNYLLSKEDNIKKQYIINSIKKLIKEKNLAKLQYLYYDCFGICINDNTNIISEINDNFYDIKDNLYNFLCNNM